MTTATVHIGKKIKEIFEQSRLKGTEFAALINKDRQVIYDIFKRETIDTGLLKQISKVLDYDFFNCYSNELPKGKEEGKVADRNETELLALGEELKIFKRKLSELEEKYEVLQKLAFFDEEKSEKPTKKISDRGN